MRAVLSLILFTISHLTFASDAPVHGFNERQNQWMAEQNELHKQFETNNPSVFADRDNILSLNLLKDTTVRPYAEYEDAGYLIFNSGFSFDSKNVKKELAKNLPQDVTLVVYTQSKSAINAQTIKDFFTQYIDSSRLKVVYTASGGNGFWARDTIPVPVIRTTQLGSELFTVVDARYYHGFEPDKDIKELFQAELTKHNYYFEGGNFIANSMNDCIVVNTKATQKVPTSVFKNHYGCTSLTRLPHIKGIGHADESVKFIDDNTILTDAPSYRATLMQKGFKVILLPRPQNKYETYVNSLLVNGVIYVPIFNQAKDSQALQVYKDAGFDQVIGVNTTTLSNKGLGSIHCITMTYPPVPMNELLQSMGGFLL